jgi:hypothetical protein
LTTSRAFIGGDIKGLLTERKVCTVN